MTIGQKIRYYRELNGLTQEDIANKLNTKPQNIYKYEKGIIENIPLSNIVVMAELFGISPAELAGWGDVTTSVPNPFEDAKAREKEKKENLILTATEKELIRQYRAKPEYHNAIHQLLEIASIEDGDCDEPYYYPDISLSSFTPSGFTKAASTEHAIYNSNKTTTDGKKS